MYDHLSFLEQGGEPKGLRNLWVEPAEPVRPGGGISNKNEDRQARTEYATAMARQAEQAGVEYTVHLKGNDLGA